MTQKTFNFSAINLGCNKNLVDLEFIVWDILTKQLSISNTLDSQEDFLPQFYPDPEDEEVEYVLINTCWFLSSSREEAEDTIKYYDKMGKKIIVIGCYVPVSDSNFLANLKNLVAVIPHEETEQTSNLLAWKEDKLSKLQSGLQNLKRDKLKSYLNSLSWDRNKSKAFIWWTENVRAYFNAGYGYEYLKIAEWCNNNCSFCIIPNIRWKQKSRTIEDILEEVKIMVDSWIKEIEIISQDTTRYWVDLYNWPKLLELLEKIDEIPGDFKIRLFYMYPDILSFTHLDKLKTFKKLLPYFDMPFQHISANVLKKMWRFYDEEHIYKLLKYIRQNFENSFFHTNFIVWFPWETEEDFEKLCNFAKEFEFESVSLFGYHDEPLAQSSKLSNKVDDETIQKRVEILSNILWKIYDKKDAMRKGTVEIWYIHEILSNGKFLIRSEIRAPEIDEYDEVKKKDIISWELEVWEKVEYRL